MNDDVYERRRKLQAELGPGQPYWSLASYGHYGSAREIAEATDRELLAVRNMGLTKLKKLRAVVPFQPPAIAKETSMILSDYQYVGLVAAILATAGWSSEIGTPSDEVFDEWIKQRKLVAAEVARDMQTQAERR